MKASIVEMEGLLRGKCVQAKMLVNESLAEYLVRQFDSLHERAEVAERERDELLQSMANTEIEMEEEKRLHKEGASMLRGQYDDLAAAMGWSYEIAERQKVSQLEYARQLNRRVIDLEAEITRRDAAAGEPVAVISDDSLAQLKESYRPVLVFRPDHKRESQGVDLYTAAPPAVLPDIDGYTHGLFPHAVEQLTRFRDDALALGAQQQNVVELPEPVKWPEIPFKYFIEEQVFSMLDAAGVKWEVRK